MLMLISFYVFMFMGAAATSPTLVLGLWFYEAVRTNLLSRKEWNENELFDPYIPLYNLQILIILIHYISNTESFIKIPDENS